MVISSYVKVLYHYYAGCLYHHSPVLMSVIYQVLSYLVAFLKLLLVLDRSCDERYIPIFQA